MLLVGDDGEPAAGQRDGAAVDALDSGTVARCEVGKAADAFGLKLFARPVQLRRCRVARRSGW
jgi:hypothetical protein